jgi:competence protein ComEA
MARGASGSILDPAVQQRRRDRRAARSSTNEGKFAMKILLTLIATLFLGLTFVDSAVWAAEPVNVNTATAEEIAANLKGVGLSKAQLIVAYREANGAFEHVDQLVNVKGIGIKTIDQNRDMILLGNEGGSAEE